MKRMLQRSILLILFILFSPVTAAVCPSCHNEWEILEVIKEMLPSNPVIIQGGYFPDATQKMCYFWGAGRVFIFEANPNHFQKLKAEPHLNWLNVKIYPYALDETARRSPFYISDTLFNPWVGSLLPATSQWKWYYNDATTVMVDCVNLQEWADSMGVPAADFIWLNIGGAELRVLKSSPRLVQNAKVILLETYDQKFREGAGQTEEVKRFLAGHDFVMIHQWKILNYQGYSLFMKRGLTEVTR